ncbi:MAG: hypothetical protein ACRD8U_19990, partial [Pyrinomonadaceae bacterium]
MRMRAILSTLTVLLIAGPASAGALQRDHLTQQEVDRVKDAQVLDQRIEIFVKAMDRRLLVLNGTGSSDAKQIK